MSFSFIMPSSKVMLIAFIALLVTEPAFAALPWETPLAAIQQSLSGPTARAAAIIAIVVTGLLISFTEISGIFGHLAKVVFGLSLALMAAQWMGMFGSY